MGKIKLKSYKKKANAKDRVILISMLVLFLTVNFLIYFNKRFNPILIVYVEEDLRNKTIVIINETVRNAFNENNYNYEEFTITSKNREEEIVFIDFDTNKVNILLDEITKSVVKNLTSNGNEFLLKSSDVYYVPFGITTNLTTFSWIGPQIPVRVVSSSSAEAKVNTNLKSYGINNALLEVGIELNVRMHILMPFTDEIIKIDVVVPVVKKMVQGSIPSIYGGLYSNSSNVYSENVEK